MKLLTSIVMLLLVGFITACSKDDTDSNFSLVLQQPQNINAMGAQFSGTLTGDNLNDIKSVEMLWSMSPAIVEQISEGRF
jgi:hypothetical protein